MKYYISIIILAIFLFSCNGHSKHWETLSQVESYIEEKPDSALVTLEQIDLSELSGKEEKAKHALLYSMALDKNFVDKTDFEVLQPAIDYYEDNGSATDKLRTYYYQGRIYQNAGNDALAMESFVKALATSKQVTPNWRDALNALLDSYFGPVPEKFTYKGKEYTPKSFAASLGLDFNDYIEIGSFTHHPFYEPFMLEVQDNWLHADIYNVKLDELIEIMDKAIMDGYTVGWGSDVSEKGFSWKNGVAIVPDEDKKDLSGTEKEKWEKLTPAEKAAAAYSFDGTAKEKAITQQMRQEGFDNFTTTDDHGMHIVGIYKDANGNKFYKVKNSWGDSGKYNGYFYASEAFVKYKTIDIQINKNALSAEMKAKLKIK